MKQFTEQQLKDYSSYEVVRLSGKYNMFDPSALWATGLEDEAYMFVMDNFRALKEAYAFKKEEDKQLPLF